MQLSEFRAVFMPYCLRKQPDGRYVVLNREYKPVGFVTTEYVKYEDYPVAVHLEGIKPSIAAKLSYNGDRNTDEIFLYNDGCTPTSNAANMKAYLAKLQILAGLNFEIP